MRGFQASFTAGEISPNIQGRVDVDIYTQAAKTIKNFIIRPTGGADNRPGTYFIENLYNGSPNTKIKVFNYKTDSPYILVFILGNAFFYIVDGDDIIPYENPITSLPFYISTPYNDADIPGLSFAQTADTLYITSENHNLRKIVKLSDGTFNDYDVLGPYGPWNIQSDGIELRVDNSVHILYSSDDLFDATFDDKYIRLGVNNQIDETVFQWGKNILPDNAGNGATQRYLTITDVSSRYFYNSNNSFNSRLFGWADASTSFAIVEPYSVGTIKLNNSTAGGTCILKQDSISVPQNTNLNVYTKFAFLAGSGTPTITVKVGTTSGASDITSFTPTSGTPVVISTGTNDYLYITYEYSNTVINTILFLYNFSVYDTTDGWTNQWALSSGHTDGDYFNSVIVYNQRLVLAGSPLEPHKVHHSKVAKYENFNFDTPLKLDDGFSYEISTRKANNVRWISELNGLVLGTTNGVFKINGTGTTVISPDDQQINLKTDIGSSATEPLKIGRNLVMIHKDGKDIYQLQDSNEYGYEEKQINYLVDHLFEGSKVRDWSYQSHPNKMLWVILEDGTLLGCTYMPSEGITAWQTFETDGEFMSVEVVDGETSEIVLFTILRTIDGSEKVYFEKLMPREITEITSGIISAVDPTDAIVDDFFFLDSGISFTAPGATTLTGIAHLEAKEVYCIADGSVIGPYTVSSGEIIIDSDAYNKVHVGLKYESVLETLDLTRQQGVKKRVSDIMVQVYKTRALKAGKDAGNLDDVIFKLQGDNGAPEQLISGYVNPEIEYPDDDIATLFFKCDEPVPCTILTVIPVYE